MAVHQKAKKLAKQIAKQHIVSALPDMSTNDGKYWCATYQGAESADANLTQIWIGTNVYRNIPRAINAWTSTPTTGASLLVLQFGGSFIIICQMIGNPQTVGIVQGAGG